MLNIRSVILGCGSSGGVPRIGNDWGVCDPDNPKNRRSRCGIYVEVHQENTPTPLRLLIDTAPELREQLIRNEISMVDAVLFTHTHADQCHGIDDLRVLAYIQRRRMPVYAMESSLDELKTRFSYCFSTPPGSPYPPILDARDPVVAGKEFFVEQNDGKEVKILPLDQDHGNVRSLGFRIGDFAYCNDVVKLPDESLSRLSGLDVLVVDALRYADHPTHANVKQALAWIDLLKPRRAIMTNLHIDLDYDTLKAELPSHVEPAFDGMVIETYFP